MTNIRENKSFIELTGIRLPTNSFLNMFNILRNHDDDIFLNVFKSYIISNDILNKDELFEIYVAEAEDWWDNISYKYYKTASLWWLVAMVNGVNNPFEDMYEGRSIKVLKRNHLYQIFKDMKDIAEV